MTTQTIQHKHEEGFTLVELAIVMVIIGLLIGGVLGAQEMITNSQATSTIARVRDVDTAMTSFRDLYRFLPGDLNGAAASIPNCTAACAQDGDANGAIGTDPGLANADIANENGAAWAQLAAAGFLTGVDPSQATTAVPTAGVTIPEVPLGNGGMQVGNNGGNAMTAQTAAAASRRGNYVLLDNSGANISAAGTAIMTPARARQLDQKIDDGLPNTGGVLAMGAVGATACADVNTAAGVYRASLNQTLCGLYIRIQN